MYNGHRRFFPLSPVLISHQGLLRPLARLSQICPPSSAHTLVQATITARLGALAATLLVSLFPLSAFSTQQPEGYFKIINIWC